jgi:hypothetical protein
MFALFNQALDRRARMKELLVIKAVELAKINTDMQLENVKHAGGGEVREPIEYAERYYGLLEHLQRKGKLPANWRVRELTGYPPEHRPQH